MQIRQVKSIVRFILLGGRCRRRRRQCRQDTLPSCARRTSERTYSRTTILTRTRIVLQKGIRLPLVQWTQRLYLFLHLVDVIRQRTEAGDS